MKLAERYPIDELINAFSTFIFDAFIMNPKDVTIATITVARNSEEEKELKASLQQLSLLNIPVIIADGGSILSFIDFLNSISQFTVLAKKHNGVWPQANNSVQAAGQTGTPFIFYTEPDKKDFFQNGLPQFLKEINAHDNTGIVMASRSEAGFASFPSFQQMTETTINNCCAEITGKKRDYCYGPFLLNKKLIAYLNLIEEDVGWGWRPYLFNMANRLGYKTDAFEKDFFCPPHQREDDAKERLYRMRQLEQNIRGLVLSTNVAV